MSSGTSRGGCQSAVVIPVPAAEDVVGRWRNEHDPVAAAGVPAHITLVVPWLPPARIGTAELDELDGVVKASPAFDFALTRVGWFGRRVLWLAPEPAEPFRSLTGLVSEHFGTPPWGDEFDEVVPHLTVGHVACRDGGGDLAPVAAALAVRLPVICRAEQVWVMTGDGSRWTVRHRRDLPA